MATSAYEAVEVSKQEPPRKSEILDAFPHDDTALALLYACQEYQPNPDLPTIICITGISGGGKDTIMGPFIASKEFSHVRTATSRPRRVKIIEDSPIPEYVITQNLEACTTREEHEARIESYRKQGCFLNIESPTDYIWMRFKRDNETDKEYLQNLIEEHDLVEFDQHYQKVYGLPRASLLQCSESSIPVVRVDINGAEHLQASLTGQFNLLTIGVIPDTWVQVEAAIGARESGTPLEMAEKARIRLLEDQASVARFGTVLHFVIHNHRGNVGDRDGLAYSVQLLQILFKTLIA